MDGTNGIIPIVLLAMLLGLMLQSNPISAANSSPPTTAQAATTAMLKESAKSGAVELTFEYPVNIVSGKENIVSLTIRNNGEEPVKYNRFNETHDITFTMKRGGKLVPPTLYNVDCIGLEGTRDPYGYIKKGQEIVIETDISLYFDLSTAGDYDLTVLWTGWLPTTKVAVTLKTDPIKVTVTEEAPKSPKPAK